jgi:hypothetical protein
VSPFHAHGERLSGKMNSHWSIVAGPRPVPYLDDQAMAAPTFESDDLGHERVDRDLRASSSQRMPLARRAMTEMRSASQLTIAGADPLAAITT